MESRHKVGTLYSLVSRPDLRGFNAWVPSKSFRGSRDARASGPVHFGRGPAAAFARFCSCLSVFRKVCTQNQAIYVSPRVYEQGARNPAEGIERNAVKFAFRRTPRPSVVAVLRVPSRKESKEEIDAGEQSNQLSARSS
jgi:hypothetical protein